MKLQNKAKHAFQHSIADAIEGVKIIEIGPGEIKDVPDDVAKVWLKTGEIVEFVAPEDLRAKEEELNKKIEKLEAENAKLKVSKPKTKTKK